jgi:hypothetical protein
VHTHRETLVPGNSSRYSDILHVRPRTLPHANSKGQPLAIPFGPVELSIWVIRKLAVSGFSSCRHECPTSAQFCHLMHFYGAKIDQRVQPAIPIAPPTTFPAPQSHHRAPTSPTSLSSASHRAKKHVWDAFGVCCCSHTHFTAMTSTHTDVTLCQHMPFWF